MKDTCSRARCSKPALPGKRFCSMECRNIHVSEMMTKRAVGIKKQYGNSYYVKGLKNATEKEN